MIWTGSKALLGAILAEILLRAVGVIWVLRISVGWQLREKNSKTTIRKTKREASFWQRVTLSCFWDAKSDRSRLLRFFISIYHFMLFTMFLPLVAMLLYYVGLFPMDVAQGWVAVHFYLDMAISIPTCIYTLRRFGKR